MQPPGIPAQEAERLATLQSLEVLDTPPEERFDRLTRMARRMFDVPIALVSLVDENRQWFKSCIGIDASETPRDISFCGHSILGDETFVIPNALEDERFADNPLVTGEPNIRFYAGRPLRALNGLKMGTLCLIDTEPRSFEADDLSMLSDLATMVEQELAAVQMATLDDLTEISNRRGFIALAKYALEFCVRQKVSASLLYFDLDNFKPINDQWGHAEGDRALKTFANCLRTSFRESDLFARIGGDEFVALLIGAEPYQTEQMVRRFKRCLDRAAVESALGYSIEFSNGAVRYDPALHDDIEKMLSEADQLMYEEKNAKR